MSKIARDLKCSRGTVSEVLNSDEAKRTINEALASTQELIVAKLPSLIERSLQTLDDIQTGMGNRSEKLAAAKASLGLMIKLNELTIRAESKPKTIFLKAQGQSNE
jgi:hypothetical protein